MGSLSGTENLVNWGLVRRVSDAYLDQEDEALQPIVLDQTGGASSLERRRAGLRVDPRVEGAWGGKECRRKFLAERQQ